MRAKSLRQTPVSVSLSWFVAPSTQFSSYSHSWRLPYRLWSRMPFGAACRRRRNDWENRPLCPDTRSHACQDPRQGNLLFTFLSCHSGSNFAKLSRAMKRILNRSKLSCWARQTTTSAMSTFATSSITSRWKTSKGLSRSMQTTWPCWSSSSTRR